MSHVNGKNRKELLAMAKVQGESKKGELLSYFSVNVNSLLTCKLSNILLFV
jgi:hypothetical protein